MSTKLVVTQNGARQLAASDLTNGTTGSGAIVLASGSVQTGHSTVDDLTLKAATPTVSGTDVGLGNTTGFGDGVVPTALTTVLLGTGTGPANPQTVVKFIAINIGGTTYWIPLVQ